ncbi:MAG TPA: methyl-accepting chemotaxis protein [Spirochaetia bacterium]|nr:methyl-accepting chemotaxis protein [Spirochaetia bacterium]
MKNLRLAGKIGFGFGLVIVIVMGLGAVSILNMWGSLGDARRLTVETVPQVGMANNIERDSLLTMYNMRGYTMSLQPKLLDLANIYLKNTLKDLDDAEALAAKYPRLVVLRKNVTEAKAKLDEYARLADQTTTANAALVDARKAQDAAANDLFNACTAYITGQTEAAAADARRGGAGVVQRMARIAAINEIVGTGRDLRAARFRAQAESYPSHLRDAIQIFAIYDVKLQEIEAAPMREAEKNQLADVRRAAAAYADASTALLSGMTALADLNATRDDSSRAMLETAKTSSVEGLKDASSIATLTVSRLVTAALVLLGGVAAALLIGIVTAIAITRTITRPLSKGVSFAQIVAAGDLTGHLEIRQHDEVGDLVMALNTMAEKLKDMLASVQQSASLVATSSEQISASAQKLSEGAQLQASTLEETSASVEQLTASVDQVSDHARSQSSVVEKGTRSMAQVQTSIEAVSSSLGEISGLARKSVENAVEGAKAVDSVVTGINTIAVSSEKIAGIVTVISEIADQTNLLALNAAIEAARAGEHGRGFAVVADEVSKLADRSASSTKEIETLIKESVRSVNEGVKTAKGSQLAMEQIRAASQRVNEMIEGLTDAMARQVAAIRELSASLAGVSELSRSISAATEEQSTNARQVSKAVENVNEITQSAASSAEEMSSATEQLNAMAQDLQKLVGQFKIAAAQEIADAAPASDKAVEEKPTLAIGAGGT